MELHLWSTRVLYCRLTFFFLLLLTPLPPYSLLSLARLHVNFQGLVPAIRPGCSWIPWRNDDLLRFQPAEGRSSWGRKQERNTVETVAVVKSHE